MNKEEIDKMKKQLEEKENIACNWKDSCLENAGKIEKLETQQKEFIEWLEAMNRMYQNEYKDIDAAEHYNCVLQKYKSIIGDVKNENNNV